MFLRTLTATACALAVAAGLSAAAVAADASSDKKGPATVGAVEIHQPWARASAGMARAGGSFMTLVNTGETADALLSASSDVAATVELHTHIKEGDVMRMRPVERIDLPAGETVMLQPGGLHVMLIGLHAPLEENDSFDLTLTFEKAGETTVTVDVKGVGAMSAAGGHGHGHGNGNAMQH